MPSGKKLTIEYIKDQFTKEGYKLLTTKYINSKQKLEYICSKGHRHSISWGHWQQGQRCRYCFYRERHTIEFVEFQFEKEGYKLLTTEYINSGQKLLCECPRGHIYRVSWANWHKGRRCSYCSGKAKKTIEFIRSEFAKEGYQLLTKEYKNTHQKLEYICPKGHKHNISLCNWKAGYRCSYCVGLAKLTIKFIRSEFIKEGYTLLTTEYKNSHQELDYICPEGHSSHIRWTNWQQGRRCSYCVGLISKGEIAVRNFVESLGIEVLANDRNQIFNPTTNNGLELDIWMPDLNKAIEYNGEYWHRTSGKRNNDTLKRYLCKQNNIDLLTIWDSKWKEHPDLCEKDIEIFVAKSENF